MCYIQVNHTINKGKEVKFRPISKLITKNVITVPYTIDECDWREEKILFKGVLFLFSLWAPAYRKHVNSGWNKF